MLFVCFAFPLFLALEPLLVGVYAALQAAKLLRERIGQVDLVEIVGREETRCPSILTTRALTPTTVELGGTLQHHRVRADAAVIAHGERAEHLGAGRDQHVVADGRVALAGVMAGAAERDPVVDRAVVSNLSGFANDDAHAVVDEQAAADGRALDGSRCRSYGGQTGKAPAQGKSLC